MKTNHKFTIRTAFASIFALFYLVFASDMQGQQYATGTFTWDNGSTPAWSSVSGGPYSSVWTSGNNAVFEGTAGTVSVAAAGATAHNLTFTTNGFLIQNNTLTLNGTTPTIFNAANTTNIINSVIAGTAGLTKTNNGTLILGGANTFTGTTTINVGELDITNWGAVTVGPISVATINNATGTLGVVNGTLNLGANALTVGAGGTAGVVGIVNQTGGTVSFTGTSALFDGNSSGRIGIYNLSGGTLSGFASANRGVILGVNSSANGTFNLSGSGNLAMGTGALQVGRTESTATGTTGVYNQSGGTAAIGTLLIGGVAANTGTTATLIITNGTFSAASFPTLVGASSSSATITLGGAAQVSLPAFPTPVGTVNLTFDFTTGYLSNSTASASYLSGLTHAYLTANGAIFNVASGKDITIGQVLANAPSQTGILTKIGNGTLTLTGANTFTGNTIVSAGKLVVSSAQTSATGAASVADGATLGVTTSGSSQWSPTSLTLGNSTGCTLEFNNIANPGTSSASLNAGAVTRNGTVTVNITTIGGALIAGGSGYPLVANVGGSTNGYSLGVQPPGVVGHLAISGSTLTFVADTISDLWNAASPGGTWDIGTTAVWAGKA